MGWSPEEKGLSIFCAMLHWSKPKYIDSWNFKLMIKFTLLCFVSLAAFSKQNCKFVCNERWQARVILI